MTLTKQVPLEWLHALELHPGDVVRVVTEDEAAATVQIEREEAATPTQREETPVERWIRMDAGSVRLPEGMTVDDVRMEYYREKYKLDL